MARQSKGSTMRFTRWAGISCLLLLAIAIPVRAASSDGVAVTARAAEPTRAAAGPTTPSATGAAGEHHADAAPVPVNPATEQETAAAAPTASSSLPYRATVSLVRPAALRPAAPRPTASSPAWSGSTVEAMVTVLPTEPVPVVARPATTSAAPSASTSAASVSDAGPQTPPEGGGGTPSTPPTQAPRTRTVWSCPNGGELIGLLCVTTRPYTLHTEVAEYTFHEESTPYTYHRETRYGQPCTYLPNPSAPGGLDIFCTPYAVDVRDGTPAGWQDSGSAWVRQVRDATPVGWSDTGTRWTREVKDDAPAGFTDDGSAWRKVEPATSQEVPA